MEMSKQEILEIQEAAWDEGVEDLKHNLVHPLQSHPESTGTDNPYTKKLRELEENPEPRSVRNDDRIEEALELFGPLRDGNSYRISKLTDSPELLDSIEAILRMGLEEDRGDFDVTPATLLAAAINRWRKSIG